MTINRKSCKAWITVFRYTNCRTVETPPNLDTKFQVFDTQATLNYRLHCNEWRHWSTTWQHWFNTRRCSTNIDILEELWQFGSIHDAAALTLIYSKNCDSLSLTPNQPNARTADKWPHCKNLKYVHWLFTGRWLNSLGKLLTYCSWISLCYITTARTELIFLRIHFSSVKIKWSHPH